MRSVNEIESDPHSPLLSDNSADQVDGMSDRILALREEIGLQSDEHKRLIVAAVFQCYDHCMVQHKIAERMGA